MGGSPLLQHARTICHVCHHRPWVLFDTRGGRFSSGALSRDRSVRDNVVLEEPVCPSCGRKTTVWGPARLNYNLEICLA
jgi:hypothetical protein